MLQWKRTKEYSIFKRLLLNLGRVVSKWKVLQRWLFGGDLALYRKIVTNKYLLVCIEIIRSCIRWLGSIPSNSGPPPTPIRFSPGISFSFSPCRSWLPIQWRDPLASQITKPNYYLIVGMDLIRKGGSKIFHEATSGPFNSWRLDLCLLPAFRGADSVGTRALVGSSRWRAIHQLQGTSIWKRSTTPLPIRLDSYEPRFNLPGNLHISSTPMYANAPRKRWYNRKVQGWGQAEWGMELRSSANSGLWAFPSWNTFFDVFCDSSFWLVAW